MRIGRLRHRVEIQKQQHVQDQNTGEMVLSWVEFATVWAEVAPLSANRLIAAQASQSKITATITIRYREGMDASMRIIHRDKAYYIAGVLPDNKSGLAHITLPVSEGLIDG